MAQDLRIPKNILAVLQYTAAYRKNSTSFSTVTIFKNPVIKPVKLFCISITFFIDALFSCMLFVEDYFTL